MVKKGLGRGLGALLPDYEGDENEGSTGTVEIETVKIKPNPYQPRTVFNQEKLEELARSITENGIIQPIIVTASGGDGSYQLVAGERRLRAANLAGLQTVPALVREFSKNAMIEIALIENLQREDLNPLEEGEAYQRLIKEFGFTQEQLAKRLGRSRSAVANTMRLLSLDSRIKTAIAEGKITSGQARPLLAISDAGQQWAAATVIIKDGLSARGAEEYVQRLRDRTKAESGHRKAIKEVSDAGKKNPFLLDVEERLQRCYGTKVRINERQGKGIITINFYSSSDLERIVELLFEGER